MEGKNILRLPAIELFFVYHPSRSLITVLTENVYNRSSLEVSFVCPSVRVSLKISLHTCLMYFPVSLMQINKSKNPVSTATVLMNILFVNRGKRWRSWLRHYATSRKVAGSIPDDVIGIFH